MTLSRSEAHCLVVQFYMLQIFSLLNYLHSFFLLIFYNRPLTVPFALRSYLLLGKLQMCIVVCNCEISSDDTLTFVVRVFAELRIISGGRTKLYTQF